MGIVLLIGLVIFAFTQRTWERTDVDVHFSNYYNHGAEDYKENCFKPRVFRGFLKFKVSCSDKLSWVANADLSNQQLDEYFSKQIPFIYARGWDWSIIAGKDLRDYGISMVVVIAALIGRCFWLKICPRCSYLGEVSISPSLQASRCSTM